MDSAEPAAQGLGLVDHHCHGVVLRDLDRLEFESLLNEATRPSDLGMSLFDSMAGLAVRRWCAPVLGLEPLAPAGRYLSRRRSLGGHEVARRFLTAANTDEFLVDTGYSPEEITSPDELARLARGHSREILRLETLTQNLLASGVTVASVPERVVEALRQTPAVGAKSIAAYRTGLALPSTKPAAGHVLRALTDMHPGADGTYRVAHPVLTGWLAWTAIEAGLPLQFHVGYGDNDINLRDCDPLLLTDFLRATEDHHVPVLLLHNYPFHRQASYLAQVFEHVFMDVGLATHNSGALSGAIVRESLELVPFGKMLYSSDAFGLPELYYLGATMFRRALATVLEALVGEGEALPADAARITALIGSKNARRVYRLDELAR